MCGRYELQVNSEEFRNRFNLSGDLFIPDRQEYAPTVSAPIIQFQGGERHFSLAKWGLIPSWWKAEKPPESTFNARSETVNEKPMFRLAFRKRRCLSASLSIFRVAGIVW